MAKGSRPAKIFIFVEVLQNGVLMTETCWSANRRGTMYLTSGPGGELVLPHYPFTDNRLDFMRCARGKCELEIDHRWEGFCTSKGKIIQIDRKNRGRHVLELGKGDYASVARDDLRIMVRIGPQKAVSKKIKKTGTDPAYRSSFTSVFFATSDEWMSLGLAAIASLVIVGGLVFGLAMRPNEKPQSLADLDPRYVLPFIGSNHLRTAPEAMQENLDRHDYVRSVIDHYIAFSEMLLGRAELDERQVFPTTRSDYVQLFSEANAKIEQAVVSQHRLDDDQLGKKGTGVLSVPTVVGESAGGSMLRLIDKINIKQVALVANLEAKRLIINEFPEDPNYDFQEYKNLTQTSNKAKEYLSKIRPWDRATDEEAMYAETERLGRLASRLQRGIYQDVSKNDFLNPVYDSPIGLPNGARFASFVGGVDFMMTDDKMYQIQASEWGGRPTKNEEKVREPLVGEIDPSLIEQHIQKNRFQLQLCYELALRRNEAAQGTMEWKWRIDSRGLITDLALVSSSIQDQKMVNCIREKIATWRFPRPRRGSVEISYPFEFAPTKG